MKAANPIMKGEIPSWRIEKLNHAVKGDLTLAQKAYAWVLSNPNVAGCLSDMKDPEMMKEMNRYYNIEKNRKNIFFSLKFRYIKPSKKF